MHTSMQDVSAERTDYTGQDWRWDDPMDLDDHGSSRSVSPEVQVPTATSRTHSARSRSDSSSSEDERPRTRRRREAPAVVPQEVMEIDSDGSEDVVELAPSVPLTMVTRSSAMRIPVVPRGLQSDVLGVVDPPINLAVPFFLGPATYNQVTSYLNMVAKRIEDTYPHITIKATSMEDAAAVVLAIITCCAAPPATRPAMPALPPVTIYSRAPGSAYEMEIAPSTVELPSILSPKTFAVQIKIKKPTAPRQPGERPRPVTYTIASGEGVTRACVRTMLDACLQEDGRWKKGYSSLYAVPTFDGPATTNDLHAYRRDMVVVVAYILHFETYPFPVSPILLWLLNFHCTAASPMSWMKVKGRKVSLFDEVAGQHLEAFDRLTKAETRADDDPLVSLLQTVYNTGNAKRNYLAAARSPEDHYDLQNDLYNLLVFDASSGRDLFQSSIFKSLREGLNVTIGRPGWPDVKATVWNCPVQPGGPLPSSSMTTFGSLFFRCVRSPDAFIKQVYVSPAVGTSAPALTDDEALEFAVFRLILGIKIRRWFLGSGAHPLLLKERVLTDGSYLQDPMFRVRTFVKALTPNSGVAIPTTMSFMIYLLRPHEPEHERVRIFGDVSRQATCYETLNLILSFPLRNLLMEPTPLDPSVHTAFDYWFFWQLIHSNQSAFETHFRTIDGPQEVRLWSLVPAQPLSPERIHQHRSLQHHHRLRLCDLSPQPPRSSTPLPLGSTNATMDSSDPGQPEPVENRDELQDGRVLNNLRQAYHTLSQHVQRALNTQVGNRSTLAESVGRIAGFRIISRQHQNLFPPDEWSTLERSLLAMVTAIDSAVQRSADPFTGPLPQIVTETRTGKRGRPKKVIDPTFLQHGLSLRGTKSVGDAAGVHPRTVRRRALELGLVAPCTPVRRVATLPDGSQVEMWTSTGPIVSSLSQNRPQLDELVTTIHRNNPRYGENMTRAALRALGHRVPKANVVASLRRVRGPADPFGMRVIKRRKYNVVAVNSLWHHDGHHAIIRYKIVTHCFIDGKSRMVVGIRVSNNNRATTVLQVFDEAIRHHGVPSRVRGDHGTENVLVAARMVDLRGPNRGSYIWGRSVHNVRIERLWRDYYIGAISGWYDFFHELEAYHDLDVDNPTHIWLLHHLFLSVIDEEAQRWAATWNNHNLRTERNRSPQELFLFGLAQQGARGIGWMEDGVVPGRYQEFGIDWDFLNNPRNQGIVAEVAENDIANTDKNVAQMVENLANVPDPGLANAPDPARMNEVPCETPSDLLPEEDIAVIDRQLWDMFGVSALEMTWDDRKALWDAALGICRDLYRRDR
ncbi:hypothetical protein NMY22_g4931 [Coprinellus aureogranulatus]|nr:hypothetical protein NMY22_g4931 [Coprinellus aureogranulatus]